MILEVSAFRGGPSRCACGSSAGGVFEKMPPALEPHAHRERTPSRAETSRIIAFVLAGVCPHVGLTARWPPPFRIGHAKRYSHRGFDHREAPQKAKTSIRVAFGVSRPEGWRPASSETHIGDTPCEHKRYDSRGFGFPRGVPPDVRVARVRGTFSRKCYPHSSHTHIGRGPRRELKPRES